MYSSKYDRLFSKVYKLHMQSTKCFLLALHKWAFGHASIRDNKLQNVAYLIPSLSYNHISTDQ
jgi:hypothetical protein